MTEKRLEKIVELDASPDQVWQAIATGPGISAWFVPTEVGDGVIRQDFGSGNVVTGQVRADGQVGTFRYGGIIRRRLTKKIHYDVRAIPSECRQLLGKKRLNANVVQPYRVQHATRCLHQAWARIAPGRFE